MAFKPDFEKWPGHGQPMPPGPGSWNLEDDGSFTPVVNTPSAVAEWNPAPDPEPINE